MLRLILSEVGFPRGLSHSADEPFYRDSQGRHGGFNRTPKIAAGTAAPTFSPHFHRGFYAALAAPRSMKISYSSAFSSSAFRLRARGRFSKRLYFTQKAYRLALRNENRRRTVWPANEEKSEVPRLI